MNREGSCSGGGCFFVLSPIKQTAMYTLMVKTRHFLYNDNVPDEKKPLPGGSGPQKPNFRDTLETSANKGGRHGYQRSQPHPAEF